MIRYNNITYDNSGEYRDLSTKVFSQNKVVKYLLNKTQQQNDNLTKQNKLKEQEINKIKKALCEINNNISICK